MKYIYNNKAFRGALLACAFSALNAFSGTITINGTGSTADTPILVTSAGTSIDIGTRVRIGTFTNLSNLTSTILNFTNGTANYAATLASLNSNFADLGTGVVNFGTSSQVALNGAAFTPSTTQFGFNNISSLTVDGKTSNYNVFNGTMTTVNYSSSIGASKNLYLWVAFNDEIGIVRNSDGTGTSAWITPTSDLSGVPMNLSGINSQSEVLLGNYINYASGTDLVTLIPEPSTGALVMLGAVGLVAMRRLRKA
jgi:hypothetical protein